ncbi:MAG: hypothetical protein BYD32DRAFT_385667 [Podila humilis]|nr:MAG: hypothetical protein BYD32DRAFT_385667 [Podila humilis]
MIACDGCDDWFHGDCVGVAEKDSELVDKYYCKRCEDKGNHGSRKKKCSREECSKAAVRKSKYCSRECGLLVATERIRKSQERVFGGMSETNSSTSAQDASMDSSKAHLQRRRRLTLADLDDRQRLLSIREKMAQVRKVCSILDDREKQLEVCVDRQARQDLGEYRLSASSLVATTSTMDGVSPATLSPSSSSVLDKEDGGAKGKAKGAKTQGGDKSKDKDKDALCGFDYSLVWDDAEDMSRVEKALSSMATPAGSRASSVAPPSFGVVITSKSSDGGVITKKQDQGASSSSDKSDGAHINGVSSSLLLQLQGIGHRVCVSRKNCDRHVGWQKLKAAELDLEKTLQSKLLKSLKAEAKLVKSRMRRRRTDLSAGILNGTIEH